MGPGINSRPEQQGLGVWTTCEERKPCSCGLGLHTECRGPTEAQVPTEHALQEGHEEEEGRPGPGSPPSLHYRPSFQRSGFEGSHTPAAATTPLSARLLNSAAEAQLVGLTYCKAKIAIST